MPDFARSTRPTWAFTSLIVVVCAGTIAGCASWKGTEPAIENMLVSHYNRLAAEVSYPDASIHSQSPAPSLGEGRNLTRPQSEDRWPLSLAEAIRLGVQNNVIIKQNAQFLSPNNPVLQSPDSVPSIYDSDIQNAGVLFGTRGIDAALSDFDPRLTSNMKWARDENAQNQTILPPPGQVLTNDSAQSQTRLEQSLLSGGTFAINNTWNYSLTNQPNQLFASTYTGTLGAEFRQPLWAGAGRAFTEIAGPPGQRARGFSNVSQGIVIAQINKRLSEIDFQENLQNLVREIGDLYWDLYLNYQDYEAEHETSRVAKELWNSLISARDLKPAIDVEQAGDAYYESKAREENALSNLFLTEARLRRLLGIPLDDPRLIYPSDEPREDEIALNRPACLFEALVNRIELTRQKTNIQSLELQLIAARKLIAPKLDFIAGYALNGFGDRLLDTSNQDKRNTREGFNSAYGALFRGKETSWDIGFEYSIPLWLRQEKAQVRQLELRTVKARAALATQEEEIAFELNNVLQTIKRSYQISRTTKDRLRLAFRRLIAARSDYEAGNKGDDLYLRALTSQTQAKVAYARSITEYNKSLRDLLYRMGHLLSSDGIALLGIDGLPLLPPPSPDGPFDELPKPSDPDNPVPDAEPDKLQEEPLLPKPPAKKPKLARGISEELSAMPSLMELGTAHLPDVGPLELPVEDSESFAERDLSPNLEDLDPDWDRLDDDGVTPVSGSR